MTYAARVPSLLFLVEGDASPAIPDAPLPNWIPSGRRDFGGTNPNDFIRLSMLALEKPAFEGDLNGPDMHARSVKPEAVEAYAKGVSPRTLPDAVRRTARDRRRAGWGSAAVQHRATAQIRVQGGKGIA